MKKVIINLASGYYVKGQKRLKDTCIKHGYTGDFMLWQNESQINAPLHSVNPYAFKLHAFAKAHEKGYQQILWLDASVYAERNPDLAFEIISNEKRLAQEAGHMLGRWTNDKGLAYLGLTRDEAFKIPMIGDAGILGLDVSDTDNVTFLMKWWDSMKSGMFKGKWTNENNSESQDTRCSGHRHDMCFSSAFWHELGFKFKTGGDILEYKGIDEKPKNNSIIFGAKGMI